MRAGTEPHPFVLKAEAFRHYIDSFNRTDVEPQRLYVPNAAAWDF